jgi:hypothetical protein
MMNMIVAAKEIGWVVLLSEKLFCKRCVSDAIIKAIIKESICLSDRRPNFKAVKDSARAGEPPKQVTVAFLGA